MKTEADLKELHDLLTWYSGNSQFAAQSRDVMAATLGMVALTDWYFSTESVAINLIEKTMADVRRMKAKAEAPE